MGHYFQDTTNSTLGHTATLTYDNMNRVATSAATGSATHNLTFSYDRYGNMTCVTNQNTNGPCPNYTFNASTNQITNSGFTYDAAGNLTADGTGTGSHSYQWDGESRLKSIDNGSTATYAYNALGQRVEKLVGSTYTEYAYHAGGEDLGENNRTAWTVRVVPFADRHLAHYNDPSGSEATYFMHSTRIGSTSQGTDYTGAVAQDQLFYPWGQVWQMAGTAQEKRFALLGHRDATETGLDPTRFRMFSSTQGRWLSKDPKSGQLCRPQTLNRYAYVQNNSPNLIDPHGTNGGDRGGLVPDPFWPGDLLNGCTDTWDPTCSAGTRGSIFGGGYYGAFGGLGFGVAEEECACIHLGDPFLTQAMGCGFYGCDCPSDEPGAIEIAFQWPKLNSSKCFYSLCPVLSQYRRVVNLTTHLSFGYLHNGIPRWCDE